MFSQLSCSNFQRCTALVGCFAFALLSSSSVPYQLYRIEIRWLGRPGHYFEISVIFLFIKYLLHKFDVCFGSLSCWKRKDRPTNRLPDGMACLCGFSVIAMLVEDSMNLIQIANSFTSRTSPGHDTASPMFDSGNNTCRTHTLVLSESHKHSLVWSKYFEFGLVHKTDFHSSNFQFLCFFAQASLFFLFITLSSGLFAAIRPFCPALVNLLWTVNLETSV